MSNFLGSAVYTKFQTYIRFSLYPDASNGDVNLWDSIRHKLFPSSESMNNSLSITRDDIFNKWKENCALDSNRQLPLLNHDKGGLGIDDVPIYKRIRPIEPTLYVPNNGSREYFRGIEREIRMRVIDGIDEKWSLEEIEDLLTAFVKTANHYLRSDDICQAEIILKH